MTSPDHHDPHFPEPDLPNRAIPDEQIPDEDQIARLLGELSQPGPTMPDHVAQRLDSALADLVAQQRTSEPVDQLQERLDARQRRRGALLVAAAACGVLTLGGLWFQNGALRGSESSQDAGGGVSSTEVSPDGGDDAMRAQVEDSGAPEASAKLAPPTVTLRGDHLRADVRRLLREPEPASAHSNADIGSECLAVKVPASAQRYYVAVDTQPAMVVITHGDRATVWPCGATTPLDRFSIRQPPAE